MGYVIGIIYAGLVGSVSGWFFYHVCIGSKKDRLCAGIMWGVGIAIFSVLSAFGG